MRALLSLVSVLGIASHALRDDLTRPQLGFRWRPRIPALLAKLALLLASTVIVLLALELVARQLVPMPWGKSEEELARITTLAWSRYTFRPDAELGYSLTPNFEGRTIRLGEYDNRFYTNSMALRDREYGPKSPAAGRILAIGDSFTFGLGVDQSQPFAEVLERRLNRDFVGDYEVINAGVNGYAIDQYEGWLRRVLPHYGADLVLVSLFVGNDFERYTPPGEKPYRAEQVEDGYRVVFNSQLESWLAHHSHLGYYAMHQLPKLTDRWNHLWVNLFGAPDDTEDVEGIVATAIPYLERIRKDAESSGAELAFMIIPDRRQLGWIGSYKEAELDAYSRHQMVVGQLRSEKRSEAVKAYLRSQGLRYLDLEPAFAQHKVEDLYFKHDGHLRPAGHALVGKLLENWVMDNFATALQRPPAPNEPMIARNGDRVSPPLVGPSS